MPMRLEVFSNTRAMQEMVLARTEDVFTPSSEYVFVVETHACGTYFDQISRIHTMLRGICS